MLLADSKDEWQGQIVIVASAAAVVSFIGYSTYAPTKFALRGLADSLRNEFLGFNVSVRVARLPHVLACCRSRQPSTGKSTQGVSWWRWTGAKGEDDGGEGGENPRR